MDDATSPCKSPDVRRELSILNGGKDTFNQIPGSIVALPCGLAAVRIGGKPMIVGIDCATAGTGFDKSDQLVGRDGVASPATFVARSKIEPLGGGPQIATSMVFAVLIDNFPMEQRLVLLRMHPSSDSRRQSWDTMTSHSALTSCASWLNLFFACMST